MLSNRNLQTVWASLLACAAIALVTPSMSYAQFAGALPAGVLVDAKGTLRIQRIDDVTGELSLQRLRELKASLAPELARPSRLRKVSLTRLEAAVSQAIDAGAGLNDEMRYLAGLTSIQYVFVYPELGDIVIAGPAEGYGTDLTGRAIGLTSGQSTLQLEDLVVALRAFAPGTRGTQQIGCSIDPTEAGLENMQSFLQSIAGRVDATDAQRIAKGLQESLGNQVVSIEGVSPKTHFAQVLVEADYRMKLIGIGLENPPVRITSYVSKANPNQMARNALQRWYFVPDYESVRVSEDALALELVGKGVKLIGESEVVANNGTRSVTGTVDRASQLFVKSFTQRYAELSKKVPVYGQLKNLIDMSIVAAFLHAEDVFGQTGWNMEVFADESQMAVETFAAPEVVESAVNVVWKRNSFSTPIGGGVQIRPELALATSNVQVDDAGKIDSTRESVQEDRANRQLPEGRWWWD